MGGGGKGTRYDSRILLKKVVNIKWIHTGGKEDERRVLQAPPFFECLRMEPVKNCKTNLLGLKFLDENT